MFTFFDNLLIDRKNSHRAHLNLLALEARIAPAGIEFPTDARIINVKNYGAVGDGIVDDTAAIRRAINTNLAGSSPARIVYFPDGVYRVTDTISWTTSLNRYLTLQGQSRDGTIIRLSNNHANYQSATTPKAVLSSAYSRGGGHYESFGNYIKDLTVDTGVSNPGAIGIDFVAHNFGGIENVRVRTSDPNHVGVAGIRFIQQPGPFLVRHVEVNGFNVGFQVTAPPPHTPFGFASEHVTFRNQLVVAISNDHNRLTFRNLVSQNSVPVIENRMNGAGTKGGFVQVLGGTFTGGLASNTAVTSSGGLVHLRDVTSSGYGRLLRDGLVELTNTSVSEYVTGSFVKGRASDAAQTLRLEIQDTPTVPWDAPNTWANIERFGAVSRDSGKLPFEGVWTNSGADGAAIQAAIDSGATTIYFPNGVYTIDRTIIIRGNVRRIVGNMSVLQLTANFAASGHPVFRFENGTHPVVILQDFVCDSGFSNGPGIVHNSSRTLVVQSFISGGTQSLGGARPDLSIAHYMTGPNGTGDVFLENTGMYARIVNQRAWIRQYNPEDVDHVSRTFLRNDGGTVWIFGIKTEGRATVVDNRNGSVEINGTGLGMTNSIPADLPLVRNENGRVSIINGTSTDPAAQHPIIVREIRNGVQTDISQSLFPFISTRERNRDGGFQQAGRWIVYTSGVVASQPPAAPSGLTATAVSSTTINLTWTDNSNNETAFIIERRIGSGSWSVLTTVDSNITNYTDTGLTPATQYTYRVRATNGQTNSAYSNESSGTTPSIEIADLSGWRGVSNVISGGNNYTADVTSAGGTFQARTTGAYLADTNLIGGSFNQTSQLTASGTITFNARTAGSAVVDPIWSLGFFNTGQFSSVGATFPISFAFADSSSTAFRVQTITGGGDVVSNGTYTFRIEYGTSWAGGANRLRVTFTNTSGVVVVDRSLTISTNFTVNAFGFVQRNSGTNNTTDRFSVTISNLRYTGQKVLMPPAAPSGLTATAVSPTQVNLTWTDNSSNETAFIIERRTGSGAWVEIATVAGNTTSYSVTNLTPDTSYSFRVRASNLAGDSAYSNTADASTASVKLSGTIIGTTGSYNNSGNDRTRVFDNNLNTFFDGPTANGVWVGLDLGTSRQISRISFAPRNGYASRMVGGYFQVSNSADFSNATTIHTINTAPTNGVLTTVNLSLSGTWRYIRYVSPIGGWGNISEMEVWGY